MKIVLARHAGFCMGVRRAMNTVLELAAKVDRPVYTVGPLFHNSAAIRKLESKNIKIKENLDDIHDQDIVVIRTHGVTPEIRKKMKSRCRELHNLTCPKVGRVQAIVKKHYVLGYHIVIIGDRKHPEVEGLKGYAPDRVAVVSSESELHSFISSHSREKDKICVLSQTTKDRNTFKVFSERLKRNFRDVVAIDTICESTIQRQEEVYSLAEQAEAVIVVGGKNSSNTKRLVEISRNLKKPTMHVEQASELDDNELRKYNSIAVTAGASTPNWTIAEVVEKLKGIERSPITTAKGYFRRFYNYVLNSYAFLALGSAALAYTSSKLMGYQAQYSVYITVFCYIMAMYLCYNLLNLDELQYVESDRYAFYSRRKLTMSLLTICFIFVVLYESAVEGGIIHFILISTSIAAGVVYLYAKIPDFISKRVKYQNIKDIPASKELLISTAYVYITTFIPACFRWESVTAGMFILASAFTFVMVFSRSVLFSVRDIHGDIYIGRETLPVLIGKKGTKILLVGMHAAFAAVTIILYLLNFINPLGLWLLLNVLYSLIYLYLFHKRLLENNNLFRVVVDSNFILAGVIAYLWIH